MKPNGKAENNLLHDTRGAVMVTGLFMATFMIGVLWYMVGIGDSIVYHDKLQEAADATAFTSAAVHARGMNFISAINLIMLALVAIHVVMGLIYYAVNAIAIGVAFIPIVGDAAAIGLEEGNTEFLEEVWIPYSNDFMKPTLNILSYVEYGAAIVYPWAGEASGVYVAGQYGEVGLSLSTSMIPGNAISGGEAEPPGGGAETSQVAQNLSYIPPNSPGFSLKGSDTKIGLPVEGYKFSQLCKVLFGAVADFVLKIVKQIPLVGTVLDVPGIGGIIHSALQSVFGTIGTTLLCNEHGAGGFMPSFDSFWGEKGPKFVWSQAQNGNDWLQVWSFVISTGYNDTSYKHVVMAEGPKASASAAPATPDSFGMFYGQAEFYFDCTDKWTGDSCNNNYYAGWAMRWRARLRRVRPPNVVGDLIGYGATLLTQGGALNFIKGKVNDSGIFDKVQAVTSKLGGLGGKAFTWLQQSGIDTATSQLKKALAPAGAAAAAGNPMIH